MKLGEKIDRLNELRDNIRELTSKIDEYKDEQNELEEAIIAELEEQGTPSTTGYTARATVNERMYASPEDNTDWEDVFQEIFDTGNTHLLYKRINAAAATELQRMGILPSRIKLGSKKSLSLTKLRKST